MLLKIELTYSREATLTDKARLSCSLARQHGVYVTFTHNDVVVTVDDATSPREIIDGYRVEQTRKRNVQFHKSGAAL